MRFRLLSPILFAMAVVLSVGLVPSTSWADGTEVLDTPTIAVAEGTGTLAAGVGLADGQPQTITVVVPDGATVQQVILYWEGTNRFPEDFTLTDTIEVNGMSVTGDFIGGDTEFAGEERTTTYREDITALGLIGPGTNTISVGGLSFTRSNDGAGVLVIYDDGAPKSQIDLRDGNDFAFIYRDPPLNETVPQTFYFTSTKADRAGILDLFVGSVADDTGVYGFRPTSFEVTTGGVTSVFSDQLNSIDGRYWDSVEFVVTVPAGADSLTVQIFSRDDGVVAPGNLPASLVWLTGAFAIQSVPRETCWVTTGGFHNGGEPDGSKDFTFGGNVGPPPRGSWQVVDHNSGDKFHSNDVHIVSCDVVPLTGPDQPGGKKGFTINQATFEGTGRFNGVDGYPFTGMVQDAGEPHGKKGNDQDYFEIVVRDPVTSEVVYETSATLDGGNVQIHPPTGHGKK